MTNPHDTPQPQNPQVVYVEKQKKPFYKRVGCIIPIAIVAVLLIIIIAAMSGGDDTSNNGSGSSAEEAGPAAIGETVSLTNADVTASNFRPSSDALGSYLCVDVAFVNTSDDDTLRLNGLMDWELQDPNGVIRNQGFGGETDYDSIELAPGGNTAGVVCFDGEATPGDYTLTFEEGLSFSSDKAVWAATM